MEDVEDVGAVTYLALALTTILVGKHHHHNTIQTRTPFVHVVDVVSLSSCEEQLFFAGKPLTKS